MDVNAMLAMLPPGDAAAITGGHDQPRNAKTAGDEEESFHAAMNKKIGLNIPDRTVIGAKTADERAAKNADPTRKNNQMPSSTLDKSKSNNIRDTKKETNMNQYFNVDNRDHYGRQVGYTRGRGRGNVKGNHANANRHYVKPDYDPKSRGGYKGPEAIYAKLDAEKAAEKAAKKAAKDEKDLRRYDETVKKGDRARAQDDGSTGSNPNAVWRDNNNATYDQEAWC
jgi:hypothetical protein